MILDVLTLSHLFVKDNRNSEHMLEWLTSFFIMVLLVYLYRRNWWKLPNTTATGRPPNIAVDVFYNVVWLCLSIEFDGVELTILISSIIMIIMVLLVHKICLAGRRPVYDDSTRCVRCCFQSFECAGRWSDRKNFLCSNSFIPTLVVSMTHDLLVPLCLTYRKKLLPLMFLPLLLNQTIVSWPTPLVEPSWLGINSQREAVNWQGRGFFPQLRWYDLLSFNAAWLDGRKNEECHHQRNRLDVVKYILGVAQTRAECGLHSRCCSLPLCHVSIDVQSSLLFHRIYNVSSVYALVHAPVLSGLDSCPYHWTHL